MRNPQTPVAVVLLRVLLCAYLPVTVTLALAHYPRDTDPSLGAIEAGAVKEGVQSYYESAYQSSDEALVYETRYMGLAQKAAEENGIRDIVEGFARQHGLRDKKVLEVGSGRGELQDIVDDYTGLDLSNNVGRFYYKPFVAASATAMPFPDNSFDAIWTVWVLEHIPEPERALMEMRRVLRPGGLLLLAPAWNCTTWAAEGYEVRPYSDFDWIGKLIKASIPIRSPFHWFYAPPTRLTRLVHYTIGGKIPDSGFALWTQTMTSIGWPIVTLSCQSTTKRL